jgi:hypothetical protein
MKNLFALLLSLSVVLFAGQAYAASAPARGLPNNIGVSYSFDDAFGTQFEFNISQAVNYAPVSVQIFWRSYPQRVGTNATWNTTGFGVAGIYDLTNTIKLDKKFRPYIGLGVISVSHSWAGNGPAWNYTGRDSGLYVTGGVRYNFNPQVAGDLSLNSFGGLTVGANFNF